jgi:hypothetical protein
MKKKLVIVCIDGRIIERDITSVKDAPIGATANDQFYAKLCQAISASGYTDPDTVTETNYTHLAPSQIKTVSVTFEKHGTKD